MNAGGGPGRGRPSWLPGGFLLVQKLKLLNVSCCGTLTDRLEGSGMRWDQDNAESIMALAGIYHSSLWGAFWKSERAVG